MTRMTVSDGNLIVEVEGWDKLWSLKSQLVIPMNHGRRLGNWPDGGCGPFRAQPAGVSER